MSRDRGVWFHARVQQVPSIERSEPGGVKIGIRFGAVLRSKHGIDDLMHIEVPFNQENNMKRGCIDATHEKA